MPGGEIVERECADGGEFGLDGVWVVGAVDELGGFALGDLALVVIAANDAKLPALSNRP